MTDGYYKCDRCGEFERGPIKTSGFNDVSKPKWRKISYGHRTGEDNSGAVMRSGVDLCEECRKDLTEWLDND